MIDLLMMASIPQLIIIFIVIVWALWICSMIAHLVAAVEKLAESKESQADTYKKLVTHRIDLERRKWNDYVERSTESE